MNRLANRLSTRRFGAALVLTLAAFAVSFAHAAGDEAGTPTELRHGSRSKAGDGTLVVWDKVAGAYRVPDHADTYWIDNRFYRFASGLWLGAPVVAGPWELLAERLVPDPARGRHLPPTVSVVATLPSGRDAVYVPRLKAWKVAGRKGVFLFDAAYYRYDGGVWLESKNDDGPWATTTARGLPPALRRALPLPEAGQRVVLPSGETIVFEAETNLFTVEGRPDAVFFDGTFYELRDNKWFRSTKGTEAFDAMSPTEVPGAVRLKYHKGGKEKDTKKTEKKGRTATGK